MNISNETLNTNSYSNQTISVFHTALITFASLGTIFNLIVCWVIFSRHQKHTLDLLIGQLALTDLFSALATVSAYVMHLLFKSNRAISWLAREIICKLSSSSTSVGVINSKLVLMAISLERYRAIIHPLKAPFRRKLIVLGIILMWLISAVLGGFLGLYHGVSKIDLNSCMLLGSQTEKFAIMIIFECTAGIIPLTVILISYIKIMIKICTTKIPTESTSTECQRKQLAKKKHRNQKIAAILIITLLSSISASLHLINYMILTIGQFMNTEYKVRPEFHTFLIVSGSLTLCSCVLNPIIYNFVSTNFKNDMKHMYRYYVRKFSCIRKCSASFMDKCSESSQAFNLR
ncbi:Neuropeptide Y receptor [Trichoplax sp. H2]|nr:Neuropeptide Y receptor [Trichoplax sp. H2]|eukprot:RDD36769.1 Neuropeptide Y receptor [Trichoplax sp. H2]